MLLVIVPLPIPIADALFLSYLQRRLLRELRALSFRVTRQPQRTAYCVMHPSAVGTDPSPLLIGFEHTFAPAPARVCREYV